MRPSLILLALAVAAPAGSAAAPESGSAIESPISSLRPSPMPWVDPNAGASDDCPPISRYHAAKKAEKLGLKKLNELPAADHYKAAYRRIGGCEVPIVAAYGVGADR